LLQCGNLILEILPFDLKLRYESLHTFDGQLGLLLFVAKLGLGEPDLFGHLLVFLKQCRVLATPYIFDMLDLIIELFDASVSFSQVNRVINQARLIVCGVHCHVKGLAHRIVDCDVLSVRCLIEACHKRLIYGLIRFFNYILALILF
jgi:hypothetical protein